MKQTSVKTKLLIALCVLLVAVSAAAVVLSVFAKPKSAIKSVEILGTGGYGAVFNAKIDPFVSNYFGALCDMGSVYFSFDGGQNWTRHNLKGTLYSLEYDPTSNGVVWAAGSGIYKSTDHGKTMELVFPKTEEITSQGNNYENANYWIYTDKQSDYAPHYQIWSMAINRKSNGKNVFAAQKVSSGGQGYQKGVRIYHTTDGQNFGLFAELSADDTRFFSKPEFSQHFKLDYDEANDCVVLVTQERILEIAKDGTLARAINQPITLHHQSGNVFAWDSCYDTKAGKNTFVFASPVDNPLVESACYKTNDLSNRESWSDLTAKLCELTTDDFGIEIAQQNQGLPSCRYCEWINGYVQQQFKWTIGKVSVLNDDVVYLYHEANTDTFDKNGNLYINRRTMAYLRYDQRKGEKQQFKWVYGMPHRPYTYIPNTTWQDSDNGFCFGMTSSPQKPDSLLFCTIVGLYYTPDGEEVRQLNSVKYPGDQLTFTDKLGNTETKTLQRVTTTGVDVICTHLVATDPFDPNHLLIASTDIGLVQSYDNGESWYHSLNEWQNGQLKNIHYSAYTNTCFDLHFDKENKNVVYGLWSFAKSAPYAPGAGYLTSNAKFGISYDGGLSWEMKPITPEGTCLPYRMQVVYNGDTRTIYLTTDSHGFFVTTDLGDTFVAMNDGIKTSTVGDKTAIWGNRLLVCDMGTFAVTGGYAYDDTSQGFYKWNVSLKKFEELPLPSVTVGNKTYTTAAIRDMVYDPQNDCLYLGCIANVVTNYDKLAQVAGGVWKYKNGTFTQIFDQTQSVSGLTLDGKGKLYAAQIDGSLIAFEKNNTSYVVLLEGMFHRLKTVCVGANDKILYVPTWGGGTCRIVLN